VIASLIDDDRIAEGRFLEHFERLANKLDEEKVQPKREKANQSEAVASGDGRSFYHSSLPTSNV